MSNRSISEVVAEIAVFPTTVALIVCPLYLSTQPPTSAKSPNGVSAQSRNAALPSLT